MTSARQTREEKQQMLENFAFGVNALAAEQLQRRIQKMIDDIVDCDDSTAMLYNRACSKAQNRTYGNYNQLVRAQLKCASDLQKLAIRVADRQSLLEKANRAMELQRDAANEAAKTSRSITTLATQRNTDTSRAQRRVTRAEDLIDIDRFLRSLSEDERKEFLALTR